MRKGLESASGRTRIRSQASLRPAWTPCLVVRTWRRPKRPRTRERKTAPRCWGGGECAGCVARRGTLSMLEGGHPPTATPDLAPECAACSARHASEYTKRFARARARRSRAHALACARNILCDLGAHLDSASSPKSLRACCVAPRSMDGLASGGGFDLGQRPRLCHRRISPRAVA